VISIDFKRLDLKPGFRVLDIGCGSGRHACAFYAREDLWVIGADLSPDDLVAAGKNLAFHDEIGEAGGGRWDLAAADITRLPFPDDFFDIVVCSEVMEHVPDEKKAASEIARVLKPGGQLAASVPRGWPEKICWRLSDAYHAASGGHIRIYRKKEIWALFEDVGFSKRGFHFAHSLHTPYWWLKCLVGPEREDHALIRLYHRFLVWDMMKKPGLTKALDVFLNPVMGKSVTMYFKKDGDGRRRGSGEKKFQTGH
jgi:SAM-dependent methyltransferase